MPPGAVTSGMDIGAVRQLAAEMQKAAEEIRQVSTRVTSKLQATPWLGPDRQKFEQDWQGRMAQQLNQIATALGEAAQSRGDGVSRCKTDWGWLRWVPHCAPVRLIGAVCLGAEPESCR